MARARAGLLERLADVLDLEGRQAITRDYPMAVAPLRIYLGSDLHERVLATAFVDEGWKPLRAAIEAETGVALPDPLFQDNASSDEFRRTYAIAVDDVVLAYGQVRLDQRFTPASDEALDAAGIPAVSRSPASLTHGTLAGSWLTEDQWFAAEKGGIELWADPLRIILAHLRRLIESMLDEFVDVDSVCRWLVAPSTSAEFAVKCRRIRADVSDVHALTRVLRALVAERVSIADRAVIVATFTRCRDDGFDLLLQHTREALFANRSASAPTSHVIRLPSEVEDDLAAWHVMEQGRGVLAMPPDEVRELVERLRDLVGSASDATLVVASAALRSALYRVTSLEFPTLHVVSVAEAGEGVDS